MASAAPESYWARPKGFAGTRPIPPPPPGTETLRGLIAWIGPAYIMAGLEVGSGEMIFAAQAGAIVGTALAWCILLSGIFKTINDEFSIRYVMATGESINDVPENTSNSTILLLNSTHNN